VRVRGGGRGVNGVQTAQRRAQRPQARAGGADILRRRTTAPEMVLAPMGHSMRNPPRGPGAAIWRCSST